MGNNNKETRLSKRVADLDQRVADLAILNKKIDHQLRIKDNWHSETKDWIGECVSVYLRSDVVVIGVLKWSDKYQIAVVPPGRLESNPKIINKGAIDIIELGDKEDGK